jgi:hypothetical protein
MILMYLDDTTAFRRNISVVLFKMQNGKRFFYLQIKLLQYFPNVGGTPFTPLPTLTADVVYGRSQCMYAIK